MAPLTPVWDLKTDRTLIKLVKRNESVARIAVIMRRTAGSIDARVTKLIAMGQLDKRPPQHSEPFNMPITPDPVRASVTEVAEKKMIQEVLKVGGFPRADRMAVPGTNRVLTVHFAVDGKAHPFWLAKCATPKIERAA